MPKRIKKGDIAKTPNYFDVLGIPLSGDVTALDFDGFPDAAQIREAWRAKVQLEHPDHARYTEADRPNQEKRFRAVMTAGIVLLDPSDCRAYQEALAKGDPWDGATYANDEIQDWLYLIVDDTIQDAVDARRAEEDEGKDGTIAAAKELDTSLWPQYFAGDRLRGIEGCNVGAEISHLLRKHKHALADLRGFVVSNPNAITWTWRRSAAWKSRGVDRVTKPRALTAQNRARFAGADNRKPYAEIFLSAAWWLVASEEERHRELFRALDRFFVKGDALAVREPPVSVSASEVREYGLETRPEAELAAAIIRSEGTSALLREMGAMTTTQLDLFDQLSAEMRAAEPRLVG